MTANCLVLAVALTGLTGNGFQQADTVRRPWDSDRASMIRQVLDRALVFHRAALAKDKAIETAVGRIEQILIAGTVGAPPPSAADLAVVRIRFSKARQNLDAIKVRFDAGAANSTDVVNGLVAAISAVVDPVAGAAANPADAMFTQANFPASTAPDRNNARALYALLTGRVNSIGPAPSGPSGPSVLGDDELLAILQDAPIVTDETERADALIALAQQYALTPQMVSAYVFSANSIQNDATRARVFAQLIRVKSGFPR